MEILNEIYYSDIMKNLNSSAAKKEFSDAIAKLSHIEKEIIKQFPECEELLNEYKETQSVLNTCAEKAEFVRGVRFGAQIILEMLT